MPTLETPGIRSALVAARARQAKLMQQYAGREFVEAPPAPAPIVGTIDGAIRSLGGAILRRRVSRRLR